MAGEAAGDVQHTAIYGAKNRIVVPIFDADGDLVAGATGLSATISKDQGAAAATTNAPVEIGSSFGFYYLDLTDTECQAKSIALVIKTTSVGAKSTPRIFPLRRYPILRSGTAQAGGASTMTLDSGASSKDGAYVGMLARISNNSPSNAQGQVRTIVSYVGSTKVATVQEAWGTNPSSASAFELLLPDGHNVNAWLGQELSAPSTNGVPKVDVNAFGSAALQSIWDFLLTSISAAGSIGKLIKDNLDAAISGRATQASVNGVQSDTTTLVSRLTSSRAGYLDNLNISGLVASSAEVTGIQNNTRTVITVPEVIELPNTGTQTRDIHLFLYDDAGNMESPDSAPTLTLTNQAGTNLSSRLDSTTMVLVETGHYKVVYTASAGDDLEQLIWIFSIAEGGAPRKYGRQTQLLNTDAIGETVLQDSSANHNVIARAIRGFDSSGITQEAASIEKRLFDENLGSLTTYTVPTQSQAASDKNEIITNVVINRGLVNAIKSQTDQFVFAGGKVKATLDGATVGANLIEISGSPSVDGIAIAGMFKNILSALQGDVVREGNTYTYKDQASATAFSYTVSTTGRVKVP